MKKIKSAGYKKVSQNMGERRFEGRLDLKIFVPRTDNEEADRSAALDILLSASQAIRESGVNTDASYGGLEEIF